MAPFGQDVFFYYCFITKGNWKLSELAGHSFCMCVIVSKREREDEESSQENMCMELNISFSAIFTVYLLHAAHIRRKFCPINESTNRLRAHLTSLFKPLSFCFFNL